MESNNIIWNERTIDSLTKSKNIRIEIPMVFAQCMKMTLRGPIGPHTVLWGLKSYLTQYSSLHEETHLDLSRGPLLHKCLLPPYYRLNSYICFKYARISLRVLQSQQFQLLGPANCSLFIKSNKLTPMTVSNCAVSLAQLHYFIIACCWEDSGTKSYQTIELLNFSLWCTILKVYNEGVMTMYWPTTSSTLVKIKCRWCLLQRASH